MALSDKTAARIDHGLASLALDQLRGTAPMPGEVSLAEIARRSGVSESTIAAVERIALAKLASQLLDRGLPPHLTTALSRRLSR